MSDSDSTSRNEVEWRDDRNWRLRHLIYCAPRDARLVVPKWLPDPIGQKRGHLRHTLNFGHWGAWLAIAMVLVHPLIVWFLAGSLVRQ